MIRPCDEGDVPAIHAIINEAAQAYRGSIPADCWHEPYMPADALARELAAGVTFLGWEHESELVGVMGFQHVRDVALIRHAYVRPSHQGRGIGGELLRAWREQTSVPVLIGTWADAHWAIRFYERHGFRLVPKGDTDGLLRKYWDVPQRQREVSVVLEEPS